MPQTDLRRLFHPRAVAVIGASQDPASINGRPIANLKLHAYTGPVYPVNPRYETIQGLRAYPSIRAVPEAVDVALVAVSASQVMPILEECAAAGVAFAMVFSAGFAETGEHKGAALQQQMRDLAVRSGMRIIGPNCIGSLNVTDRIPLGFAIPFGQRHLPTGPISFVSQSGAFGYGFMALAGEHGLGFRYIGNPGNQVDLDAVDLLQFFAEDSGTRIVAGYIEGIRDGERFAEAARTCARLGKPLVLHKVGRSPLGQRAAASHTASLAGSDAAFEAVARAYGVISVHDVEELLDVLKALLPGKLPRPDGGVGIVTSTGASGVMAADACHDEGVAVAALSPATRSRLGEFIPAFGSTMNPVDLTAMVINDVSLYGRAYEIMRAAPEVGSLAIMLSSPRGPEHEPHIADIRSVAARAEQPMVVAVTSGEVYTADFRQAMQASGFPTYTSPWRAIRALKHLYRLAEAWSRQSGQEALTPPALTPERLALVEHPTAWHEAQVKQLLRAYGIPVPAGGVVSTASEAQRLAEGLGYPVVVKALSPKLLHKSEAGAVRVGVRDAAALEAACREVLAGAAAALGPGDRPDGLLVEEMATGGVETFAAIRIDPVYGPLLGFGLGGIFVEAFRDVAWRPAPCTRQDALDLIRQVKAYRLLTGYRRGRPAADVDALADALVRLSWLAVEWKERLTELEINPLAVLPEGQGVRALDGVLIRREQRNEN